MLAEGFDEAAQLNPRSWAETNLGVYYWDGSDYINVASPQWNVDWANGSVQILEDDTTKTYFISNLHCNKESAAAGANNVDYAEFLRLGLTYVGSNNEGPGFTSGELDLAATGLDLPIARDFKGKVSDLVAQIESKVQANLKVWYDADSGKIMERLISQAALGAEDFELFNALQINNSRNISQLFSRVRFTGKRPLPENAMAQSDMVLSDLGGGVDWFGWDGQDTKTTSPLNTFAGSIVRLHDGDRITGSGVRGLVAANPYDVWHPMFKGALPAAKRLKQVIAVMPPSWHDAHAHTRKKDDAWLWPGIRLLSSTDDVNYFPVATAISGVRYRPSERVEVNKENILRPVSRYFKLYGGAYNRECHS